MCSQNSNIMVEGGLMAEDEFRVLPGRWIGHCISKCPKSDQENRKRAARGARGSGYDHVL